MNDSIVSMGKCKTQNRKRGKELEPQMNSSLKVLSANEKNATLSGNRSSRGGYAGIKLKNEWR